MDEDALPSEESDEEFRKMEKDIDEFLSSIRENVTNTADPQNEATCSGVFDDCDSISSGDLENPKDDPLLHSRDGEAGFVSRATKFGHGSFPSKKRQGLGQWKWKGHKAFKQGRSNSREEPCGNGRRGGRQREHSSSWDEHDSYGRHSSSGRNRYHPRRSFSLREGDEYHRPFFPRRDEFHQERSPSPRDSAYRHRSFLPKQRNNHHEEISVSPDGRDNYQVERQYSGERHVYKRRKFSPEGTEEHSQDSYDFDEHPGHNRTSWSRSSETESIYHQIYAEESDSPAYWSDNEDNDYDYRDQDGNPYWKPEDDDPFLEDWDGQSSSSGAMNTSSIIAACLERVVAVNPEIAQKFSTACMSLLNKSVDRTCDSDYEYDESSCASFEDQTGRVSSRSWRDSKSPSFSKSSGSFSGSSGSRHYRNRYEGRSQRIVVECPHSPSPQPGYSDDRMHIKHSNNATSQKFSTKRRASSTHHKNPHEEDPKTSVARSIKKIRRQCEEESDSTVRRALLALLKVHERECDVYLRKPEAHPDYNREYSVFLDKKSKIVIDLGGNPNEYDYQHDWKKYWMTQVTRLFKESWNAKMQKCTFMLQKKGHLSKSLHASSKKDMNNLPSQKTLKTSKCGRESLDAGQNKKSEIVKSLDEQQELQAASAEYKGKEEMEREIFSIIKLLSHMKHKFKGCEAAFDSFYEKALSLKQQNFELCDILHGNLPLLKKIDINLRETLEDKGLTLIQKAIIQETHERFKCILQKSREINPLGMQSSGSTPGKAVAVTEAHKKTEMCKGTSLTRAFPETCRSSETITDEKESLHTGEKHEIPCHVTDFHPLVASPCTVPMNAPYASCTCCTTQQVCRPRRILTQVSIQGSSSTGDASGKPKHEKDSNVTQPPPPGVTPPPAGVTPSPSSATPPPPCVTPSHSSVTSPPPGVTPPPAGVTPSPSSATPPPPGVIPSHSNVTSPLPGVTPPPAGVTLSPSSATLPSPGVTSSHSSVTSPSAGVTPPPPGVTPSHSSDPPSPPGVTPPPVGVILPPAAGVPSPPAPSAISPPSAAPASHSIASPPYSVKSPHASVTTPPLIISTASNVTSPGVTSSPGITLPPATLAPQSPLLTKSQASFPDSHSLPASNLQMSCDATTSEATQHASTTSTSIVQSSKSLNAKDTVATSQTQQVQPSKDLLRSTIKDCFLSASSPSEESSGTSTVEVPLTLNSKMEASAVPSVPILPEDILRMFVVKPEDKSETNENKSAEMNSCGNNADSDVKSAAKKPIKITIPRFSKQKRVPAFSPALDDQELL